MKLRGAEEMKIETRRLLGAMAAFVLLSVAGPMMTSKAMAGQKARLVDIPTTPSIATFNADDINALPDISALPNAWWFHGGVEVGGRGFLNNPQRNGSLYLNQDSLAKYYEYSTIKPGPFSNIWLSTGSNDGLYQVDIGGYNIGYSDQSYYLDVSKAGELYFNFGWDQTPHVYSTSAYTPFQGIGTDNLTVNPSATNLGALPLYQTDIKIRRDTASTSLRWTPTDAWDINGDYSHLSRTGTQIDGVRFPNGATNGVEVPKPVDDTTQNYGVNGEYAGTSPWGKRFTVKLGYTGSQYTDNLSSYTVQNPLAGFLNARMPLWPSNNANGFNGTLAADLPLMSRYVGTVSYTMMRQDAEFLPMSLNAAFPLPQNSLNGAINTLLSNNIVTTQITPDLTSKLSYRYYDFNNDTQQIFFPTYIPFDGTAVNANHPIQSLAISYTKQNAGAQLNWRPVRAWNLTAEYGYERYNYTQADADVTNENSGKLSADWTPTNWFTTRASAYYANRRYENYDYPNFVRNIQFPAGLVDEWYYSSAYRQFFLDNRERWKANVAVDVVVVPGVTVTPTFKYQDDNYNLDPANQFGLDYSRSLAAGVAVMVNPDLSFVFGYMYEHYNQMVYSYTPTSDGGIGATPTTTLVKSNVNTFTAAAYYAAIPNKLDLDLRYTLSQSSDLLHFAISNGTVPSPKGDFLPNNQAWFQRLDATATYRVDQALVRQMGWKGDVKLKLRYTWERNSEMNWANDTIVPWSPLQSNTELFTTYYNPNYNVHMLAGSVVASW
jgi:MtrB/PioB family decaheme-associated outer membrane protein